MLLGAQAAERRRDARLAPVCISFANSGLRTPSPETPFHLLPWYYPIPLVTRHRWPRIFGGDAAVPPQTILVAAGSYAGQLTLRAGVEVALPAEFEILGRQGLAVGVFQPLLEGEGEHLAV